MAVSAGQRNQTSRPHLRLAHSQVSVLVAGVCIALAGFLLGRLSVSRSPGASQESDALQATCLQDVLRHRPPLPAGGSGNDNYTAAPYQILSWHPRIVVFPNFINAERAQHIINVAQGQLKPSTVRARGAGEAQVEHTQGRTSSGTFLSKDDDEGDVLAWLERRIQDATLIPASHGEKFYVIRYQPGELYDVHMDPHDPAEYGPQSSSRIATMVVYLNSVAAGGETIFPREGADGAERPIGPMSCSAGQGLRYQPRQGDALLFYSAHPDGSIDPKAAHGGCPVGGSSGEKWVVTKWLHNKPVRTEARGFGWG